MFPARPALRTIEIMIFSFPRCVPALLAIAIAFPTLQAQTKPASAKASTKSAATNAGLDPGTVTNGIYRNKTLGLSYKIPDGWVLRTDDLNVPPEKSDAHPPATTPGTKNDDAKDKAAPAPASSTGAKVLLAAFSRPPEAKGEEINSSVLIAAESVSNYPGLEEAAQYFYPLEEVAKAQGFQLDEDPYAIAIDTTTLVRGDFHKDVGTRVMRQSTLALLSHSYAVSITLIAGTEDDLEGLIDALGFSGMAKSAPPKK
jgi:hypothetical protein